VPDPLSSEVRVYTDGSIALAPSADQEWTYSSPPWRQDGRRGLSSDRIRWQACFGGDSRPPEQLLVTHHDLGYSVAITVEPEADS
jgi:hypothetical protein